MIRSARLRMRHARRCWLEALVHDRSIAAQFTCAPHLPLAAWKYKGITNRSIVKNVNSSLGHSPHSPLCQAFKACRCWRSQRVKIRWCALLIARKSGAAKKDSPEHTLDRASLGVAFRRRVSLNRAMLSIIRLAGEQLEKRRQGGCSVAAEGMSRPLFNLLLPSCSHYAPSNGTGTAP